MTFNVKNYTVLPQMTEKNAKTALSDVSMTSIANICAFIHSSINVQQNIRLLVDESSDAVQHHTSVIDRETKEECDMTSLESFLRFTHSRPVGYGLSWNDRLTIALTLASSVLQLDGSSCLKTY